MINFLVGFGIGFFVGEIITVFIIALFSADGKDD